MSDILPLNQQFFNPSLLLWKDFLSIYYEAGLLAINSLSENAFIFTLCWKGNSAVYRFLLLCCVFCWDFLVNFNEHNCLVLICRISAWFFLVYLIFFLALILLLSYSYVAILLLTYYSCVAISLQWMLFIRMMITWHQVTFSLCPQCWGTGMCGSSKLVTGVVGTQMKHTHWFPYPQSRPLSLPKYSFFFSLKQNLTV